MSKKRIALYCLVLLVVSFLLQWMVIVATENGSENTFLGIVVMYSPAIVTLIFLLWVDKNRGAISWGIGRWPYLFVGALFPVVLTLLVAVVMTQLNLGELTHFDFSEDNILIKKGRFLLGKGEQSLPFFALNSILTALVFPIVGGLAAFGEELAWRGYLQEKLIRHKGKFHGILLLGLVWGFWHLPFNLNGHNYPETPVLGALVLFPLTAVFASFFMG